MFFDRLERPARGDAPHQPQLDRVPVEHLFPHRLGKLRHLYRPALVVAAPDESLALQRRDVLVDRGQRSYLQRARNLFEARRVAMLVQEDNQKIEHFFLPLGQCHGALLEYGGIVGEVKANVKLFVVFLPGSFAVVASSYDWAWESESRIYSCHCWVSEARHGRRSGRSEVV